MGDLRQGHGAVTPHIRVYVRKVGGMVPSKKHATDAGWDLYTEMEGVIKANSVADVPTGIEIALPVGWFGFITPRSSTKKRYGIHVVQGVIDSDYRGELFIQVINPRDEDVSIAKGARIAQILFLPVPTVQWVEVADLPKSKRGTLGFGSTGV